MGGPEGLVGVGGPLGPAGGGPVGPELGGPLGPDCIRSAMWVGISTRRWTGIGLNGLQS